MHTARTLVVFSVSLVTSLAWAGDAGVTAPPAPVATPAPPAAPPPDASQVKATWDYYYRAQGQGPVLVDAILCSEIGKEGSSKYECVAPVNLAEPVKVGTALWLWQSYLVPQGDSIEDLHLQVKEGSLIRETKDVKLKGEGWRARQWSGLRFNHAGEWTLTLQRGDKILKTLSVQVK